MKLTIVVTEVKNLGLLGKIVGGTIGFCMDGPVGAVAGAWIASGSSDGGADHGGA
jgi:hypothetical protein